MWRNTGVLNFHIGLSLSGENYSTWEKDVKKRLNGKLNFNYIERIINSDVVSPGNKTAWFQYESDVNSRLHISKSYIEELHKTKILEIL